MVWTFKIFQLVTTTSTKGLPFVSRKDAKLQSDHHLIDKCSHRHSDTAFRECGVSLFLFIAL